jgi:hypothetical protein
MNIFWHLWYKIGLIQTIKIGHFWTELETPKKIKKIHNSIQGFNSLFYFNNISAFSFNSISIQRKKQKKKAKQEAVSIFALRISSRGSRGERYIIYIIYIYMECSPRHPHKYALLAYCYCSARESVDLLQVCRRRLRDPLLLLGHPELPRLRA